ncbi:MAG: methyltransferase domain-containing protein [Sandaracinus sp.]
MSEARAGVGPPTAEVGIDPLPIDRSRLPDEIAGRVVRLPENDEVRARFVADTAPHGPLAMRAHGLLRRFASDFDVNAWLGTYRVCLLGRASFDAFLTKVPRRSLLDVGAGSGAVTAELAPLFERVVVTETSRGAMRALAARWEAHAVDLATERLPRDERFSVVSLLHVLDRAPRPRSLLAAAVERLAEDGRLLIACPLPVRAHVDRGGRTSDPDEWIEADGEFEPALAQLVRTLIEPAGLEVERVARTTYLSQGDTRRRFIALDDALLLCRRRKPASARR